MRELKKREDEGKEREEHKQRREGMTEEEEKKTQENKKKAPCLGFAGGDSAPADLNSPSDSTLAGRVFCALLYLSFLPCKASRRANVLAKHKHLKSSSSHNSQML